MRHLTFAGTTALALALAACSGAPSDEATSEAAVETAAPVAQDTAAVSEASEAAATPSETASATPSPSPTPTPTASASTAAKDAKPAAAAPVVAVADVPPPASFGRCAVCHNATKGGADKLGPNLYGVYGHKAAQGSFAFSQALKDAGLTMDGATLDKWLESPMTLVPGTRMSFPGIKDPVKRAEIIAYLKQQS